MAAGCPSITCALQRKGVEFCRDCADSETCDLWKRHGEAGKSADSFECYQKLEDDAAFIQDGGRTAGFVDLQNVRERVLRRMLQEYREGRSKSYCCIASTFLESGELKGALAEADRMSRGVNIKERSNLLRSMVDRIASQKGYCLELRKG